MQNQWDDRAYAGFFVRLAAFAIDSMLAALIAGIVKLPLFFTASMLRTDFFKGNFIFDHSLLDVVNYVGIAAYFVLLTYFTHTTIGKRLFGLEVIVTDKEWTFFNILYRETVGRFLSGLLCIGYLAVIVQKKKQGFHDMLCDTYVVYRNMFMCPVMEPKMAAVQIPVTEQEMKSVPVPNLAAEQEMNPDSRKMDVSETGRTAPVYHSALRMQESSSASAEKKEE